MSIGSELIPITKWETVLSAFLSCSTNYIVSKELKYVSIANLEAIKVVHGDGFVHNDIESANVFVNHK